MKLADLKNKQVVKYRLGCTGRNLVEWRPWKEGPMRVVRREKDLKRGNQKYSAGDIMLITPINDTWADHSQEDFGYENPSTNHPFGVFVVEDYYMEIEGLEP